MHRLCCCCCCSDFEDELERGYGLELSGRNDVGVGLRDGTNFYKMTTKFSTDNVRAFVESWSRGELAGLEQQQPELEQGQGQGGEEYSGPSSVVTLTNDNFQAEVTETNKDVMVEFYGEWGGAALQYCSELRGAFTDIYIFTLLVLFSMLPCSLFLSLSHNIQTPMYDMMVIICVRYIW
jgi:hypothetical protein